MESETIYVLWNNACTIFVPRFYELLYFQFSTARLYFYNSGKKDEDGGFFKR